jgi:CBS-domain-containing membrane protein
MRVEKIMTHQVTTCGPHDTLEHAASLMWDGDCGSLPVTSGNGSRQVVGIITDRDICMAALFQGKALRELRVEDSMARNVLTCRASDELEDAQRLMQGEQIRRLPVLDNEGCLMGIISMADIVRETARSQYREHQDIAASDVMTTLAKISTPLSQRSLAA